MTQICRRERVQLTRQGLKLSDVSPTGTLGAAGVYGGHLVSLDEQPASYFVEAWRESGEDWGDIIGGHIAESRTDPKAPFRIEFVRDGVLRSVVAAPRYQGEDIWSLDLGATVSSTLESVAVREVEVCELEEARDVRVARERGQAALVAACEARRQKTIIASVVGGAVLALGAGALGYSLGRRDRAKQV